MLRLYVVVLTVVTCATSLSQTLAADDVNIPDDAFPVKSVENLRVIQSESTVTITRGGNPILVYNKISPPVPAGLDPVFARSGFMHPVFSPAGLIATAAFPIDHPHQHGIFAAWVRTIYDGHEIDFWNLAKHTGRVSHDRVVSMFSSESECGYEVDLIHQTAEAPMVDVLRENWRVTAYPTDGSFNCFDIQTKQVALTDRPLFVQKYHYGGMALRGRVEWLKEKNVVGPDRKPMQLEPSGFLNDLGSDTIRGNHQHARWVSLYGEVNGKTISITVLCYRENDRAPQAARLHPTKPYFCFSPCVDGEFVIDKQHPYTATYRYLVTDAKPDADWIDKKWQEWCGE